MNSMKKLTIKDEIKNDFNKALGSVTKLLLDVYLIELLKSPNDNYKKLKELLLKTDDYYIDRFNFIHDDGIIKSLAKAKVEGDFIETLLTRIKENDPIDIPIDLADILNAMELFIKEEFKYYLFLENDTFDNYMSLINKNLDFIFSYAKDMSCALGLINNCNLNNKDRMLEITISSYARTTTTHVESTSKEFIRGLYKFCHLHILKKLILTKDSDETIDEIFKKELNGASKKGMGSVEVLLEEFFNFPTSVSEKSHEEIKKLFSTFKTFIERRNKIIHEDVAAIDDFNYIINNCNKCNDFLVEIFNEYVTLESNDILIEEVMTLSQDIAQNNSKIIDKLYSEAKNYM
ncbi:MAG: hypothetical protein P4L95_22700 [Rouxiella aceris]|uniref:hypothetical protein n=1 Tax=Rouxiella aceris TaxID=2703884 RepID=UPI002846981C|nr:hypothetical protein [Rouxiella aceris]MDR3434674.1 hypothetical protein [Rouxiella aceris]